MRHSTGLAFLLLMGVAPAARAQNPADSAAPAPAPGQPKAPSAPLIAAPLEDVAVPGAAPADSTTRAAPAGGAAPAPATEPAPAAAAGAAAAGQRAPLRDTTLVVDKVVAVVGNHPILASQVDEEIFARQSQGLKPPSSPAELAALR
ncbi:MAG: hypothetical protein ACM34D_14200, partial [Gemmatimonadota bacterium]